MSTEKQLATWEHKIRNGLGAEVAREIKLLNPAKVSKRYLPQIANLARRTGEYKTALSALKDDYLAARDIPLENEALIVEYAAILTEVGATAISERLFNLFQEPKYEMTPFYRALLWMKKWEYEKVPAEIELFKKLCTDEYRIRIADVNLLSALIVLKKWDQAAAIIAQLRQASALPAMYQGILDEQEGELLFFSNQNEKARELFLKSLDHIGKSNNPSAVYAEKWLLIVDLLSKPWSEVEQRWHDFSARARERGYWEVLRELEKYYAIKFKREDLLTKLYFGTPLLSYRKRLFDETGFKPGDALEYPTHSGSGVIFDTEWAELFKDGKKIKLSYNNRMVLSALTRDLYKPTAVGSLFEAIYPQDYFHPSFANKRIYQNIFRVRELSEKLELHFNIETSEYGFLLVPKKGFTIRYHVSANSQTQITDAFIVSEQAQKLFGKTPFSANELAELTGIPKRTINRIVADEVATGKLKAVGAGRSRKYQINQ